MMIFSVSFDFENHFVIFHEIYSWVIHMKLPMKAIHRVVTFGSDNYLLHKSVSPYLEYVIEFIWIKGGWN